ncbi:MAG: 50S ribosomal protein L1 [Chloroflexia bacterium]|nr:50S ribosomal protein L1 [Chloroflexia bacterium]
MRKRGKKYVQAAALVDRSKAYEPEEAVALVKKVSYSQFDGSVEAHIRLGIDPRKADQQIRGTMILPHGTGKEVRVLVFAEGEAEKIAEEAGADYVGGAELVEKISNEGWVDFDVAIAIPSMMRMVGRLGRILGRRGLMPNPKSGTIVPQEELPRVLEEVRQGKVEYRNDKQGQVHVIIGRVSFSEKQLLDNLTALMDAIRRARPPAVRGTYIRNISISPSMGPGVKVDVPSAMQLKLAV